MCILPSKANIMRLLTLTIIGATALTLVTAPAAEKKADKPATKGQAEAANTIDLKVSGMT